VWVRIASARDAAAARLTKASVEGQTVVCGIVGGRAFAFDSSCPHKGGPLEKGELIGDSVKCPWHGYEFDVFTGKAASIPYPPKYGKWRETGDLRLRRAKVLEGALYVDVKAHA
jgi:nitrite reductase/ring-hydroxylating ferredoxin subunit